MTETWNTIILFWVCVVFFGTGAAAYEALLQQQFDALTRLLEDGHPQVRAVAAKVRAIDRKR